MSAVPPFADTVLAGAARALGPGSLHEPSLVEHVFPLFSRVLKREGIYLANHSLGRPLDQTAEDVREALDLWYADMDHAWGSWLGEIEAFRARVARLINWPRADAIIPKTAAGQGLRAVLNALPPTCPNIVTTTGEFDSIDFILRSYESRGRANLTLVEPDESGLFHADDVIGAIRPETDLVVVSIVCYATGQLIEGVEEIIACAHAEGALVLLDAYHAAGAMPLPHGSLNADFIVGGSYKYTRGGPGACFLAIHPRHLDRHEPELVTLDTGWFARKEPFAFERGSIERAGDGHAWLESTPMVLSAYQARAGLELTLSLGVERLREYNLRQQAFLIEQLRRRSVTVREIHPRGAFVLVPTADVKTDVARIAAQGVITDGRPCPSGRGGHVRLCPDILTTEAEMAKAADRVAQALSSQGRQEP